MSDARVNLYHNISVMLNAGVPITRVLQSAQKGGHWGRLFRAIETQVAAGSSLTEAVKQYSRSFKKLDQILIEVGERTGQLAEMFEMLSQWYNFRQRLQRNVQSGLIYPILMIHALAFIGPVVPFALNEFDKSIYIKGLFSILGIFYVPAAVVAAIILFTPKQGPLRWMLDSVVIRLPLLGKAVSSLELSRYAKIFAITYKAGVPIIRCAELATDSVINSIVKNKITSGLESVRAGEDMGTGFSPSLPSEFVNLWQVGEESGELDDSAWRLGDFYAEKAESRFVAISQWAPRVVYAIVASIMIYYIFKGYSLIYGNLPF